MRTTAKQLRPKQRKMSSPTFGFRTNFLPFSETDVDEEEYEGVREVLDSGNLSKGTKLSVLETEFAERVGCRHAVAVQSNAAAIHLTLKACGLERGDEVITTPYAYASTAGMIRHLDAHPVFVDVDSRTLNIDPSLLERAITGRTRAIVPLHIAGLPADMTRIHEIAGRRSIAVIEDASCAFPPQTKRSRTAVSDAACFSLLESSIPNCGFGGMICTDSTMIANRCRVTASNGIGQKKSLSWDYEILTAGFQYGMNEITAALALSQFRKSTRMWQRRREIAMTYNAAFSGMPEVESPTDDCDTSHAWQIYMMRLNHRRLSLSRDGFLKELHARNIGATVHFIPLHLHPYYRTLYAYESGDFPIASWEYEREVSLPIYSTMEDSDVQDVIDAVIDVVRRFRA
ncbi:MAG: DegT/DnrJ/EryC1/StrS aminotransferase family protein [Planctomycetota bacterium]|nr:DegT/DnrJ/EryC1/StrS aminotransferase family protein [Planctomycetota bacterium]